MSAKNWQAAAAAAAGVAVVLAAAGFLTPGARADKVEKSIKEDSKDLHDALNGLDRRTTTLEANYGSLRDEFRQGNARVERKVDQILDQMLEAHMRPGRRSAP